MRTEHAPESLRVFVIGRAGSSADLGILIVDLPIALARRCPSLEVVFMHGGPDLGWHAHVADPHGEVLLSFPWTDHVDRILKTENSTELPLKATAEGWDDLDQGWWGRVVLVGGDVYVAETELDALPRGR